MLFVGHVQLDDGSLVGEPLGDPTGQRQPAAKSGQHHRRALFLSDPGDPERDGRVGQDAGDEDALACKESTHRRHPAKHHQVLARRRTDKFTRREP